MKLPAGTTAEDFAEYIATHKPYLIEIENEIQAATRSFNHTTLKIDVHIRGGNVNKLTFWLRKEWDRSKQV